MNSIVFFEKVVKNKKKQYRMLIQLNIQKVKFDGNIKRAINIVLAKYIRDQCDFTTREFI